MNTYKTEGIIVKKRNYKEADKILTVYSKEYGKLSVLAKGIRKITSKRAPSLELFNHVSLVLHPSKFIDIVTEASVLNSYHSLKTDLTRISRAYQACELVDMLTAETQENDDILYLLITYLEQVSEKEPVTINYFKRKLLMLLGFLGETDDIAEEIDSFIESIAERKLLTPRIYE